VRFLPPRTEPYFARQLPQIRSYPGGYDVASLGTFPPGCPVPHPRSEPGDRTDVRFLRQRHGEQDQHRSNGPSPATETPLDRC
jgi:hypothetical protein